MTHINASPEVAKQRIVALVDRISFNVRRISNIDIAINSKCSEDQRILS
jgi:hypothetical protein